MVNKQKILIVDDDANIAELISLYLTKECFDTMIVEDGESALRAVDTFAPNLILLDLMLPGIDGYQVCREVRSSSSVPIIMLSAKGEIFDKVLGLSLIHIWICFWLPQCVMISARQKKFPFSHRTITRTMDSCLVIS